MGQAKQRGTREQRIEQSIAKSQETLKKVERLKFYTEATKEGFIEKARDNPEVLMMSGADGETIAEDLKEAISPIVQRKNKSPLFQSSLAVMMGAMLSASFNATPPMKKDPPKSLDDLA